MSFERVDIGDSVRLYRGDCLELLKTLEPGSVDAVVTDKFEECVGERIKGTRDTTEKEASK